MKRLTIEKDPKIVGKRQREAITDKLEEKLKGNTIFKKK